MEIVIDTASITTGDLDKGSRPRTRDEHLRSADFFNVAEFPKATFKANKITFSGDNPSTIEGELTLIEDGGETVLRAGDCATFPKGTGNGHHMINRSSSMAVYLEAGSRHPQDLTTCSDIDMKSANSDGRFVHKDGTPYPGQ